MSQATKTAQLPQFGLPWATPRKAIVTAGALAGVIVAGAVAFGSFIGTAPATSDAAVGPDAPALSRLDDYGLRHAGAVPATTLSRLDDYGLRHPSTVQATTVSRIDDYGLRQPGIAGTTTTDPRLDDYGLRHRSR